MSKKRFLFALLIFTVILLTVIFYIAKINQNITPLSLQVQDKLPILKSDYSLMGEDYTNSIYDKYDAIIFGRQKEGPFNLITSPIEWIILDKKDDKVLLLSKYIIDCKPFDYVDIEKIDSVSEESKKSFQHINWASCSLRTWLNNEFMIESFSEDERSSILQTTLSDTGTTDKIFCLNEDEYYLYFDNGKYYERDRNIGDEHIYYNGATIRNWKALAYDTLKLIPNNNTYEYWLRDKFINRKYYGIDFGTTKTINYFGDVNFDVNYNFFCGVRPAMWVSIK